MSRFASILLVATLATGCAGRFGATTPPRSTTSHRTPPAVEAAGSDVGGMWVVGVSALGAAVAVLIVIATQDDESTR